MTRILIVDDEPRILVLLQSLLKQNNYEVQTANNGEAALDIVRSGAVDITVTDLRMAPMDGIALFKEIKKIAPSMPVIFLTAYATVETAIEAMKTGVFDYISKPFKVEEMMACLKSAEEKLAGAQSAAAGRHVLPARYRFENFIATSNVMKTVCDTIQKVSPTGATVLINGESGTGKEIIARTIHENSTRADKPMIAINCAAVPESELEREVLGYVKGAFADATCDKEGLLEAANGGTLFIDGVESLSLVSQGKLLNVLQKREFCRLGTTTPTPIDVRIIVASDINLEDAVVKGLFRSDLYYRLAVITLDIPPLRKRTEDIIPLVHHFIKAELADNETAPEIDEGALYVLLNYSWPGNVRELENAIRHALTFREAGAPITKELLPQKIVDLVSVAPQVNETGNASLKSFLRQKEREYIEKILSGNDGDKESTAKLLKVNLSTLYRKLSTNKD